MLSVINIDVIITCSIVIIVYAFIAKERSKNWFEENQIKIKINNENWQIINNRIFKNKAPLILIPLVGTIILESFRLYSRANCIKYIMSDEEIFKIVLDIPIKSYNDIFIFLYANIGDFVEELISFIHYYNSLLSKIN